MMKEFHFTGKQFKEWGWDGDLNTLEDFKAKVKSMLELGWNPEEMSMPEFALRIGLKVRNTLLGIDESNDDSDSDIEDDDNDDNDYEKRRRRALLEGWDEEEMDLEEFEDYFIKH